MPNLEQHASRQYDQELDALRTRVLEMGGLVETQITTALEAFVSSDSHLIDQIVAQDHRVNALEVALDDDCAHIIARRQPTAGDLRLILSVSKAVTDLERIGDEAAKVARRSRHLHERGRNLPSSADIRGMGDVALSLVQRALDAFARLDVQSAQEIIDSDRLLDDKFDGVMRQLITFVMEDPRTISATLDIVLIAKAIERIGDHAKNIAEYVIYIVQGTDIRHINPAPSGAASSDVQG